MTTLAPDALKWLAAQWENAIGSAVCSGIVGNEDHTDGYHLSRQDLPPDDWSVCQFADDQLGDSRYASALDMTMSTPDMKMVTGRLVAAWSVQDPRLDAVRAFNGTLDGENAYRWDVAQGTEPAYSTPDHTWHIHLEIFRRYANDMTVAQNVLSVVTGQSGQPTPPTQGQGEEEMKTLMRYTGLPEVFLTDGLIARYVTGAELSGLRTLAAEGSFSICFDTGRPDVQSIAGTPVRVVGERKLIGRIIGTVPAGWEDYTA